MPKIESALVRMRRRDRLGTKAGEFGRFLHAVFAYRRKTLRKALAQAGYSAECEASIRAEQLSPEEWLNLFNRARPLSPRPEAQ